MPNASQHSTLVSTHLHLRHGYPLHGVIPEHMHRVGGYVVQLDETGIAGGEWEAAEQHPRSGGGRLIDGDGLRSVAVLDQVARAAGVGMAVVAGRNGDVEIVK